MDKYKIIEPLGKGAFGSVNKAIDINTNEIFAIKEMKKKYTTWEECLGLREVNSLAKLNQHDNIIKLKEMIRDDNVLFLVFEYMEQNLYELMKNKQKFTENQIRSIIYQTLQGTAYIHKYGFFHRDFKPENLLVKGDNIKIGDFGLAREIRSKPPYTDYVSTRWYRAPECILRSTNYNSPIDIWAIGTIMAELYLGKPLFPGDSDKNMMVKICGVLGSQTLNNWSEGIQLMKKFDYKMANFPGINLKQIITEASKDDIDLMYEMLQIDPLKRPTAQKLLEHPFFQKANLNVRLQTPTDKQEKENEKFGLDYNNKGFNFGTDKETSKIITTSDNNPMRETTDFAKIIDMLKKEKEKSEIEDAERIKKEEKNDYQRQKKEDENYATKKTTNKNNFDDLDALDDLVNNTQNKDKVNSNRLNQNTKKAKITEKAKIYSDFQDFDSIIDDDKDQKNTKEKDKLNQNSNVNSIDAKIGFGTRRPQQPSFLNNNSITPIENWGNENPSIGFSMPMQIPAKHSNLHHSMKVGNTPYNKKSDITDLLNGSSLTTPFNIMGSNKDLLIKEYGSQDRTKDSSQSPPIENTSPKESNNNEIDFDNCKNYLKQPVNNNRQRSAMRFIEESFIDVNINTTNKNIQINKQNELGSNKSLEKYNPGIIQQQHSNNNQSNQSNQGDISNGDFYMTRRKKK